MSLLDGFGDFLKTPQGQGLLAGVAGYAATARRGTPINNIGRGALAGLGGYANTLERNAQAEEGAFLKQFKQAQLDEMQRGVEQRKLTEQWRGGLAGVQQQMEPGNPNALRDYAMQPGSPFADELLKQKFFPKAGEGYSLNPGDVRFDSNNREVARGPEIAVKSEDDAKIKQFKFAKENGYQGTFAQFVTLGPAIMAGAMAPLRDAQVQNIQAENDYNLPQLPRPRAATGGASVTVGGQTFSFPNQAAANSFKLKAGVK